jgi:hypothetical protein
MIRFTYTNEDTGQSSLGIGITREDIEKLVHGLPVVVRLSDLGQGVTINGKVLIYFGETQEECFEQIAEFVSPETKVILPI